MLKQISTIAVVIGMTSAAFADLATKPCIDLKGAIETLDKNAVEIFEDHSMSRGYRDAVKARSAEIAVDPEAAMKLARQYSHPASVANSRPVDLIVAMDALARSAPKVGLDPFVTAAEGISRGFRTLPKDTNINRYRTEFGMRVINALDLAEHKDALRIFRLIEEDEAVRKRLVAQNNAPLSMLKALKKIAPDENPGPEIAEQLYSARVAANAWIKPQLKIALSKKPAEIHSDRPASDWALARVLATEMKRLLKVGDPSGSAKYDDADKKLAQVKDAALYMQDPRVKEWLETYKVPH